MRFKIGDTVRIKQKHRRHKHNYGDGEVIFIYHGADTGIRVRWDNKPTGRWREESLRLLRRAS